MNYSHNNPYIKKAIWDYLADDTIINAPDLHTKASFLTTMEKQILEPRNLNYKVIQVSQVPNLPVLIDIFQRND